MLCSFISSFRLAYFSLYTFSFWEFERYFPFSTKRLIDYVLVYFWKFMYIVSLGFDSLYKRFMLSGLHLRDLGNVLRQLRSMRWNHTVTGNQLGKQWYTRFRRSAYISDPKTFLFSTKSRQDELSPPSTRLYASSTRNESCESSFWIEDASRRYNSYAVGLSLFY